MSDDRPLVIVSNRGPAEFERDEDGERTLRRGGGGLVTALSGLVAHRGALWIASAMTDEDVDVSREAGGAPPAVELDGVDYEVLLVESDPTAYDRFYNVIANPILWFIQHYLWDLSNAPDIRQEEADAWDEGYESVNADIAAAVLGAIEDDPEPLVMLHDYHLYTCPALIREARPDVLPAPLRPHPVVPARQLADPARADARASSSAACWPTTSSASTPAPTAATSCIAAES